MSNLKLIPAAALALMGTVAAGVIAARSLQAQAVRTVPSTTYRHTLSGVSKNPLPRAVSEAIHAQSVKCLAQQKEARRLMKLGRYAEARSACYRALALTGKMGGQITDRRPLQLLGDIYLKEGRYRDAISIYNWTRRHSRVLELDVNTALAYVYLGDLKSARHFYSEEKVYGRLPLDRKAEFFAQLPGTSDAKSFKASLYFTRACNGFAYSEDEDSAEDYQAALRLCPHNGLFAYHYAQWLMILKRYDEALPIWAIATRFGKGETAREAKNSMGGWPAVKREQAMRDVEKIT